MKDEKGREMRVAGREGGGRMATPWAPEKAEGVRENLQRAPGWRNLSILQFEGSCCMCSNKGFSCIETNWFFKLQILNIHSDRRLLECHTSCPSHKLKRRVLFCASRKASPYQTEFDHCSSILGFSLQPQILGAVRVFRHFALGFLL